MQNFVKGISLLVWASAQLGKDKIVVTVVGDVEGFSNTLIRQYKCPLIGFSSFECRNYQLQRL